MTIRLWSTTAASNNMAVPEGAPEGWKISEFNNWARNAMAQIRGTWQDAQYFDWGHSVSYVGATSFKVTGVDVTGLFVANQRVKAFGGSTVYGDVVSSTFAGGDTTVVVSLDSGNLDASLTSIGVGILTPSNNAIPKGSVSFAGEALSVSSITSPIATFGDVTASAATIGALVADTATISSLVAAAATLASILGGTASISALTLGSALGLLYGGTGAANSTTASARIAWGAAPATGTFFVRSADAEMAGALRVAGDGNVSLTYSGSAVSILLTDTAVSAGTYTAPAALVVDAKGRITGLSHGAAASTAGIVAKHSETAIGSVITIASTATFNFDDTIPQATEGSAIAAIAYKPVAAGNRCRVRAIITFNASTNGSNKGFALFVGSGANAVAAAAGWNGNNGGTAVLEFDYSASASGTITFAARGGISAGNLYVNGDNAGAALMGGTMKAILTVDEIQS